MNILHLSDLHFGSVSNAKNWYSQLVEDLKHGLSCNKIDIMIISGDVANKAIIRWCLCLVDMISNRPIFQC